jgi:mannose-6-phosphate isomerase
LLTKLIDARARLSLQVHPNDQTAGRLGGEAKTEMWYVLDADPGAKVFAGFNRDMDEESFRAVMAEGNLESVLNEIPVSAGDVVFVSGGLVHAIDAGCFMLEIQQNSDTTYRLHDWDHVGHDGKPRTLHVEQALAAMDWLNTDDPRRVPRLLESSDEREMWELVSCPQFRVTRLRVSRTCTLPDEGGSFRAIFAVAGHATLEGGAGSAHLKPGTSCLVPASLEDARLVPEDPFVDIVLATVPRCPGP